MIIIKGNSCFAVNVFFYQMLKIQLRRLTQNLKIHFDEKDITLDVKFNTTDYTSIQLYFFKDKRIKEMQNYIASAIEERKKYKDIDYGIYDRHEADVWRSIDFNAFHMWNGEPITNSINLRLLTLKHIQSSSYYNRVKPNYDKHIDQKLSDSNFEEAISKFISDELSYPYNMSFNSIDEEKEFVYSHNTEWHANFLYSQRYNSEKYNLIYLLFNGIYKKNKDYYIKNVEHLEDNNILTINFLIKDKNNHEYSLSHIFEKEEEIINNKYSGEEISYHLPKYIHKDTLKILTSKVDDKKYKTLIKKFEDLF